MKLKALLVTSSILFSLFSCRTKPENPTAMTEDDCGLANFNYLEVTDTTHIVKSGDLQSGVVVNGKIVINPKIKVDSVGAYIRDGDKVFIDQKTSKVFRVSQDFFEKFTRMRSSLCAIEQDQKSGKFVDDSTKREAQHLKFQIIRMFSGLMRQRKEEKSKKRNEKGRQKTELFQTLFS